MCRWVVGDHMSQSGGGCEGALVALVVVEVDVADGRAVGGVDGDVPVVADGGDRGAGFGGGEGVDGGVVLAGQVAGAAVGGGGVPGVPGGAVDGGVVAAGVVVVAVGVQQRLGP